VPTNVPSYAKINLGLRIGPVRPDGYHELATVYQTIDLHDLVTVSAHLAERTEITLHCRDPRVPRDARNTCWKIVEAALDALALNARVHIDIDKRLPVQGGLGAGSGNAAAALLGLERELAGQARTLTQEERLQMASRTGSDVPLFLVGGTVWGTGRGELVEGLADSPALACVVAVPDCAISTPQAFKDWDSRATSLTESREFATLNELNRTVAGIWRLDGSSGVFSSGRGLAENPLLALVQTGIENDFESVVFPQQPMLRDLKLALAGSSPDTPKENSALYAALSGSGAALFGLYSSDEAARLAADRVRAAGCVALVTRTLPRTEMGSGFELAAKS
jgi:4-diphosphocytidyl-2-C-methyl-D-erythritol kinase